MLKSYIFANALRLRKGIDYSSNNEEGNSLASLVPISSWVDLVNKYTSRDYSEYSIRHMLSEYVRGNIGIEVDYPEIYKSYGDVEIYSDSAMSNSSYYKEAKVLQQDYMKDRSVPPEYSQFLLVDDVVYEEASIWYVVYGKVVIQECLLIAGNRANRLTIADPKFEDIYYPSFVLAKFYAEELELETYRILSVSLSPEMFMNTCVQLRGGKLNKLKPVVYEKFIRKTEINGYHKYNYVGSEFKTCSVEELKMMR